MSKDKNSLSEYPILEELAVEVGNALARWWLDRNDDNASGKGGTGKPKRGRTGNAESSVEDIPKRSKTKRKGFG